MIGVPPRFVAHRPTAFAIPFTATLIVCAACFMRPAGADSRSSAGDGLAPARTLTAAEQARLAEKEPRTVAERWYQEMSPMGAIAAGVAPRPGLDRPAVTPSLVFPRLTPYVIGGSDVIVHGAGDVGAQSETSIGVNATGMVLVAGYNDARGFPTGPDFVTLSVSGVARSTDGGFNWAEVPVGPGGAGTLPTVNQGSVYGDPDVVYDPTRDHFVYSSIYVRPSDGRQGVCVSVSNADASAWSTPMEVTPSFIVSEAGDKPFIDVNVNTGRLLATWSSFGSTNSRILSSYSDDGGTTWSAAATLVTVSGGNGVQASVPRFVPGATNATSQVCVVWRSSTASTRNMGLARSTNGGASWLAPVTLTTDFTPEDMVLGNDRVNVSPSMAVDDATTAVYLVYQANNAAGEGDIALQRSTNAGASWSSRVLIDSNPGADRAQIFPWVTVDQSNHRVHVLWYDQDPLATGDVTELMHTYSTDAGVTWTPPAPLFDRPFHMGYGNDTSQPNLGDYIGAIAASGKLHSLAGATAELPLFNEGLPSATMISPDSYYDQRLDATNVVSLRLGNVTFVETCAGRANGALDPGESAEFTFPLENYVGNALDSAAPVTAVSATLSSSTPGVTIPVPTQSYPDIGALGFASNGSPFVVQLDPSFVPGTYVHLLLTVNAAQGSIQLPYLLATGSPGTTTTLISENFDGVAAPALPAGWSTANGGTGSFTAWVTSGSIPGGGAGSNAAFHSDATSPTQIARLHSPYVTVPSVGAGSESYVTLDFDLAYSTEDDPAHLVQAFDGLTLRIVDHDQISGLDIRAVLAEAFAEILTTGSANHFPKHTPRASFSNYFQDLSVWAGYSAGYVHVFMKFAGAGLAGRTVRLRFEYTQDGAGTCTDASHPSPCGVAVDNIVLRQIVVGNGYAPFTIATSAGAGGSVSPNGSIPILCGGSQNVTITPDPGFRIVDVLVDGSSVGRVPSVPFTNVQADHTLAATFTNTTDAGPGPPLAFGLGPVGPNPNRGRLGIEYRVAREARVRLSISDLQGREVARLADGTLPAGTYHAEWEGAGADGARAPAGIYYIRYDVPGQRFTAPIARLD